MKKAPASRAAHLPKLTKGHRLPGSGRKKGTPNKYTRDIREALLQAANLAGTREGLVGYLRKQADDNPTAFMAMLRQAMPSMVEVSGAITLEALVLEAARRRAAREAAKKET